MTDMITIRGFVATTPTLNKLPSGLPVANFRVASTPRWYDAQQQVWREGTTNWYTINSYRALAQHANRSIFVGQPVIVTGRLNVKQWSNDDGRKGTTVEIDASAIGHDLNLGTTSFNRAIHPDTQGETQKSSIPDTSENGQHNGISSESETFHPSENAGDNAPDTHGLVEGNTTNNEAVTAMV